MYNFTSLNSLMYVVDSNSNSGNETAVPRAMWAPGEDDSNRAEPLSSPASGLRGEAAFAKASFLVPPPASPPRPARNPAASGKAGRPRCEESF